MGYSFTDLGAEGCCRSLNALLLLIPNIYGYNMQKEWSYASLKFIASLKLFHGLHQWFYFFGKQKIPFRCDISLWEITWDMCHQGVSI